MLEDDDEVHALAPFLEERLPALGLDFETYGAYILPLLTDAEEQDDDEWASVMELLQASSESHIDDTQAWLGLRRDIDSAWKAHRDQVRLREQQEHDQREHNLKSQIERDREIAREAEASGGERKKISARETTDDAKRALVDRFAYEDDNGNDDDEAPVTNQEVAKQREEEASKELRSHKQTTKKEEQQKTKEARLNKVQLKEERKKRATKGERKR